MLQTDTLQLLLLADAPECPILEPRFSLLKQSIIDPANQDRVISSYEQLKIDLEAEASYIARVGSKAIPEINFAEILANDGCLPDEASNLIRERGCIIIRGVVPEEQATKWETELIDYTKRHAAVGGFPKDKPQNWNLWWTPPQVQIRSHPDVLKAMNAVSKLWHVSDDRIPFDLGSQVVYPDRFRIRYPTTEQEYALPAHQDTGAIERWEDPKYRSCYEKIFEGNWKNYDAFNADHRSEAKSALYDTGSQCSAFRSMQGWLSLSHTNTGEGTLRLVPNVKLATAYIMLRPFFVEGETFDDTKATFPGSKPGLTQFYPTTTFHPHLQLEKTMVGIPPVKPGDYVFWHCDLIHEVDKFHPGTTNSSVSYNACIPLCRYNIENLVHVRESFRNVVPPLDFRAKGAGIEHERDHDDNGARLDNILSLAGRRALGLERFDADEDGLSEGQRKIRSLANELLGFA